MAREFEIDFVNTHEYDHGIYVNCKQMIGNNIWFWFLPIAPSLTGNGYIFYVNKQNKLKMDTVMKAIQEKRQQMWQSSKLKIKAITCNHGGPQVSNAMGVQNKIVLQNYCLHVHIKEVKYMKVGVLIEINYGLTIWFATMLRSNIR